MTDKMVELQCQICGLNWLDPVPDDLQSEVRMAFNEALAGGPNTNGDSGPVLTPNHALDCVLATRALQSQAKEIERVHIAINDAIHWLSRSWPEEAESILRTALEAKG